MDNPHKIKETFILLVLSISILCICYNLLELCDCFRCCKCPKCKKNNQINVEEPSDTTTSSTDTLTNVVIATLVDPSEYNENYIVIATPIHSEQQIY